MKIVVIGLGNFGMSLAIHLSNTGNEVIVADQNMEKVNLVKDKVAHAVAMDATNENAYQALPLNNADIAIIAIGERNGASIMSTAILKKLTKAKIIARSASALEDTILQAMGVDQIIHPEQEYAERFTKKINLKGSIDNFELDDDYLVSEVSVGKELVGKTIQDSDFRKNFNLNIITIIRKKQHSNLVGRMVEKREVVGLPKPEMVFQNGDVLAVFGKDADIKKYLKNHADGSSN
ncbi:K+ transport system, NAD-binding component [Aequorivita sublithincola DSM 14238]|uniref:K+ transport system, NAD-binding component n=1 Tax=Aequorivita sublithincola (strain DSM 14238 / LMG 21431 / ACAM 643 / 9-3) TaxID=746697 RepID=I3YUY6_AEQSU|nr:TrkA family potassium uptake protein [Aequorivita sublithincola]AFL80804.1 K+ transport system, NAD-binding component [Aequorivita sublithincola DSM 14238]